MIDILTLYVVASVVNFSVSLSLGAIVFYLGPKVHLNQVFSLFVLLQAIANIGHIFWMISNTPEEALHAARIIFVGVIFMQVVLLHFIYLLIGGEKINKAFLVMSYCLFTIFLLFEPTNYFIEGFGDGPRFPYTLIPGPVFVIFMSVWFLYMAIVFWYTGVGYFTSHGSTKKILAYVSVSHVIGFSAGIMNVLSSYSFTPQPAAHLLISLALVSTAYPVVKYQLMSAGSKNMVSSVPGTLIQALVAIVFVFMSYLLIIGVFGLLA